jgi:hypothetical protein
VVVFPTPPFWLKIVTILPSGDLLIVAPKTERILYYLTQFGKLFQAESFPFHAATLQRRSQANASWCVSSDGLLSNFVVAIRLSFSRENTEALEPFQIKSANSLVL